jgi:hypothetical protein
MDRLLTPMSILTKIMNGIFAVLFIEAILFLPIVFMVAVAGNGMIRTMKYAGLFCSLYAIPYLEKDQTHHLN